MKLLKHRHTTIPLLGVLGIFALSSCTTTAPVRSAAISKTVNLSRIERVDIDIDDTSSVDTAFDEDMQEKAITSLIWSLEDHDFNYVGAELPEIQVAFNTYPVVENSYVDTEKPIKGRIVRQEGYETDSGEFVPTRTVETITVVNPHEPIYVGAKSRLYVLEVIDAQTKVRLWRAYTTTEGVGLTTEKLVDQIDRLVDRMVYDTRPE